MLDGTETLVQELEKQGGSYDEFANSQLMTFKAVLGDINHFAFDDATALASKIGSCSCWDSETKRGLLAAVASKASTAQPNVQAGEVLNQQGCSL